MHRHTNSLVWQCMMNKLRLFDDDSIFPASRYVTIEYTTTTVRYVASRIELQIRSFGWMDDINYCLRIHPDVIRLSLSSYHDDEYCHAFYLGIHARARGTYYNVLHCR